MARVIKRQTFRSGGPYEKKFEPLKKPKKILEYNCPVCLGVLSKGEPGIMECICGREFYWERTKTDFVEIFFKKEPLDSYLAYE